MKNRTIIGIICIVLALVVTFAVTPLVNKLAESKTDVVVLKRDVTQGHMISGNDIEIKTMYKSDVPTNAYADTKAVVGKFAECDIKVGYWLTPYTISNDSDNANDVFRYLDGTKQAVSVSINSFAGGVSGKLKNGDIISLVVQNNDSEATIPGTLTYVRVITTTTADGWDKDELQANDDGTYDLPSTLTLLVNSEQAKMLVEYENNGTIHATLVYRGEEKTAQKFLDAQDGYFKQKEGTESDPEGEDDTDTDTLSNSIIDQANDIIGSKNENSEVNDNE